MIVQKILNIFIPSRCVSCGESVATDHQLCSACWREVTFITEPFCKTCGQPLEWSLPADSKQAQCMVCHNYPPLYDQARSIIVYNDASKKLILRFKHGDATHLVPTFSHWLKRCEEDFFKKADYLIPVPLHWTRLLQRRYNQSALLAMSLLQVIEDKPIYAPSMLRRTRRTPSQGHKTGQQRHDNVKNAFVVPHRYQDKLRGKSVMLIDDVMTTGATLEECSRTLKQAGCERVFVLTVARAVKDG